MKIPQELNALYVMLTNARQHPIIQPRLAEYGYSDAKIQQAVDLLLLVQSQLRNQQEENQECNHTGDLLKEHIMLLRQQYKSHCSLARTALRGNEVALRQLGLQPDHEKPSSWLEQVDIFYRHAPRHLASLVHYGLTQGELEQGKAMIDSIREQRHEHLQLQNSTQDVTRNLEQTQKDLRQWCRNFCTVAGVAFENEPELLEILGIKMAPH